MTTQFEIGKYVHHDLLNNVKQQTINFVKNTGNLCEVTEQSTPTMGVTVKSGTVVINGTEVSVASGNLTIDAAPTTSNYNRYDLIAVNSSGTLSVIKGTEKATNDVYPNDPLTPPSYNISDYVILARVFVGTNVTTITNTDIKDLRVINANADSETIDMLVQENLEQQMDIIELQQNASITPSDHTATVVDIFSDADGYEDTIDTANTNALFFSISKFYSYSNPTFTVDSNQDSDSWTGSDGDSWNSGRWNSYTSGTATFTSTIQSNTGEMKISAPDNSNNYFTMYSDTYDVDNATNDIIKFTFKWVHDTGNSLHIAGIWKSSESSPTWNNALIRLRLRTDIVEVLVGGSYTTVSSSINFVTGNTYSLTLQKVSSTSLYYKVYDETNTILFAEGEVYVGSTSIFFGFSIFHAETSTRYARFDDYSVDYMSVSSSTAETVQTNNIISSNSTNITDVYVSTRNYLERNNISSFDVSSDGGSTWTTGCNLNEKVNITSTQGKNLKLKFNIISSSQGIKSYAVSYWD